MMTDSPKQARALLRFLARAERDGCTERDLSLWWAEDGCAEPAHQGFRSREDYLACTWLREHGLIVPRSEAPWARPYVVDAGADGAEADLESMGLSEGESAWCRETGAKVESARPYVPYVLTPEGHAALTEIELLEIDAESSEETASVEPDEPAPWLDRLRVAIARRGTMHDAGGRRRWTVQDIAAEIGVPRSTIYRSQEAVTLIRAARTAQTRAGHAELDGDRL